MWMMAMATKIIPHLNPWPQWGSILVVDNCRIHKVHLAALQGLVDEMGAKLLFLAPYCFIDAPIEVGFGQWKRWLNRHQDFDNF